jgi:predicted F0F1-ATPase subunit
MTEAPKDDFVGSVRRKADRMRRRRAARDGTWRALGRTVGIGWMVVLPVALGAALGHWLAVRFGLPSLALVGLGLGLGVGVYGAYLQVRRLLVADADDDLEEPPDDR